MADLDMYGERVADASALIREFAKTEYYHYFARDYEGSLEAFIAMLDQAEEKGRQEQAARIAELEAKLAEVPRWISVDERLPEKGINVLAWERWCNTPFIGSYEYKKWHPSDEFHDVTGYDGSIVHKVTQGDVMFWQPLPASPAPSEVL